MSLIGLKVPLNTSFMLKYYVPHLKLKHVYENVNIFAGGLIELSQGRPQNLQYVVNAVFLASLYADYLDGTNLPGWYCGTSFIPLQALRDFATSQV